MYLAAIFWLPSGERQHRRPPALRHALLCHAPLATCFGLHYTYVIFKVSSECPKYRL